MSRALVGLGVLLPVVAALACSASDTASPEPTESRDASTSESDSPSDDGNDDGDGDKGDLDPPEVNPADGGTTDGAAPPPPVLPSTPTVGTVTETKLFDAVGTASTYTALQGGASDGTFAYFVVLHTLAGDIDESQLLKYRISSGARITTASFNAPGNVTNMLGHGNDATFNPDTGKLIVPAWTNDSSKQPADNGKHLRIIDPDTLKILETKTIDVNVTNLCYANGTYLLFNGGAFRKYDANFKLGSTAPFDIDKAEDAYAPAKATRVGQGIDCDEDYVYITRWYPEPVSNRIYVANWAGNLVGAYTYNGAEGEHLMHVSGSRMLHGINTAGGGGEVRRINNLTYVVSYIPEGGVGTMATSRVLFGRNTLLRKNAFTLTGKLFDGWVAERESDGFWLYQSADGSDGGWKEKGKQPAGWILHVYKDEALVAKTAPFGLVKMHAQWK